MTTQETKFTRNSPDYEMWAHAACLTLAEGNTDYPPMELQSPAMQAVIKLVQERDALKIENENLREENEKLLAVESSVDWRVDDQLFKQVKTLMNKNQIINAIKLIRTKYRQVGLGEARDYAIAVDKRYPFPITSEHAEIATLNENLVNLRKHLSDSRAEVKWLRVALKPWANKHMDYLAYCNTTETDENFLQYLLKFCDPDFADRWGSNAANAFNSSTE